MAQLKLREEYSGSATGTAAKKGDPNARCIVLREGLDYRISTSAKRMP